MSILTARELNPGLRIVAAATDRENIRKLRRAGADNVLSPSVLGGRLLVECARGSNDTERVVDDLLDIENGGYTEGNGGLNGEPDTESK